MERTTAIDQLIKNIEAQIEKLQELRKIKIYEAITGKWETLEWYEKNKEKILLHPETRYLVEGLLRNLARTNP